MARKKLSDELKEAISNLSHKEKDSLLNRLVAKDDILTEQLEFKLLEHGNTMELRRSDIAEKITMDLSSASKTYSAHYMLGLLRNLSAMITRHHRVTRDKYGELELNILLVKSCFEFYGETLKSIWNTKASKLREYLIKKCVRINTLGNKIHPDYKLDFYDDMQYIDLAMQDQSHFNSLKIRYELDFDSWQI